MEFQRSKRVCPLKLEIGCLVLSPSCPCHDVDKCIVIGCKDSKDSIIAHGCGEKRNDETKCDCGEHKGPHHAESCEMYTAFESSLTCGCRGKKPPHHLDSCEFPDDDDTLGCGCGKHKGPHHLRGCPLYFVQLTCGCRGKKPPHHSETCSSYATDDDDTLGCGCGKHKGPHHQKGCLLHAYELEENLECGCSHKHKPSCPRHDDDDHKHRKPKCCDDVEICIFNDDFLAGQYNVTVTKKGNPAIFYGSTLSITNTSKKTETVTSLKSVVEVSLTGSGPFTPISNSTVSQNLNPPIVIPPGATVSIPFAGAFNFDTTECEPSTTFRIVVDVTSNFGTSSTSTDFACSSIPACEVTNWHLTDDGYPCHTIDPKKEKQVIPLPFSDLECGQTVENTATLSPGKCGETVTPGCNDQGPVTSNTTKLKINCANVNLENAKVKVHCKENEQWCLCKNGSIVSFEGCPDDTFIQYTISATQLVGPVEKCTGKFSAQFSLTCALPYDKTFTITVTNPGPPPTVLGSFTFTYPKNTTAAVPININLGTVPSDLTLVVVTISTDLGSSFNLATCQYTSSGEQAVFFSEPIDVTTITSKLEVILSDETTAFPSDLPLLPIDPHASPLLCAAELTACYSINGGTCTSTVNSADFIEHIGYITTGIDLTQIPGVVSSYQVEFVVQVPPGTEKVTNKAKLTVLVDGFVTSEDTALLNICIEKDQTPPTIKSVLPNATRAIAPAVYKSVPAPAQVHVQAPLQRHTLVSKMKAKVVFGSRK